MNINDRIFVIVNKELRPDVKKHTILLDDTLQNDLGADSLDIVEIQMEIEYEFRISFNESETKKWHTSKFTIRDLITHVKSKLEDKKK